MRTDHDKILALDCLRLAIGNGEVGAPAVETAGAYYAFVTGEGGDDAKGKLDAVREIVNPLPALSRKSPFDT